jgi:divalent metal cation (Fe/Co/Zn/Cd) transporter
VEEKFQAQVQGMPEFLSYHDFRVVAHSTKRIIIAADLNAAAAVPEADFERLSKELEQRVCRAIPSVAYCSFYVAPKYAY